MIAAAFYPNPVVIRMSDFKQMNMPISCGEQFEPKEENPMLGLGASRYYDERYRDAYALECQALLRVRSEMGLTNVIAMIPFCRTPDVVGRWQSTVWSGKNGLQVYVM